MLRGEEAETQFERAAKELGIKVIQAPSPQAKGRIERVFATLQDRLVKELRLAGISSLEAANRFLEGYLPRFNAPFEREPLQPGDLHRSLPKNLDLEEIFCLKKGRTINNGYFFRWRGKRYKIKSPSYRMKGKPALVMEPFDGRMIIRWEGRDLEYEEIREKERPKPKIVLRPKPPKYLPPPGHPWRLSRISPSSPPIPSPI